MASNVNFNQFDQVQSFLINLKMAKNPNDYVKIVEQKVFGNDFDSPRNIVSRFGDQVLDVVLRKYDVTRSTKNARNRSGATRALITKQGPFVDNFGNVKVTVGSNLVKSPVWRFLEFGTSPKLRVQGFQVVGPGSRGDVRQIGKVIGFSFKGSGQDPVFAASGDRFGVKLIPRKAEDLARIRRKIYLQFVHPGIPAGGFIREGYIFAQTNAGPYINYEMGRMFLNIMAKSNNI